MSDEPVRVLTDFKKLEFETVPESQLPPGLVPIHVKGVGDFYATPEMLESLREGELRHPEFPEEIHETLRRIKSTFDGLYTRTLEEWEDGFRRDMHPWRELALWEWWTDGMERFAGHLKGSDAHTTSKRLDVFQAIKSLSLLPPAQRKALAAGRAKPASVGTVTARRVGEIIEWLFSEDTWRLKHKRIARNLRLIMPDGPYGPERVTLAALLDEKGTDFNYSADFDPQALLLSADVILGVDVSSGQEMLVYGTAKSEQMAADGAEQPGRILRIEIDSDTDDLERLVAIVKVSRGRHDYRGGS